MAITYLYPISDVVTDWPNSTGANHYTEVDDPQGSPDDATTEINTGSNHLSNRFSVHCRIGATVLDSGVLAVGTAYANVSHLFSDAPGGTGWTVQNLKDLEFGVSCGDNGFPTTYHLEFYGTDDSEIDTQIGSGTVNAVTIYARVKYTGSFNRTVYVTQVYIEVDYTPGVSNHPTPSSFEIDRESNPSNASDSPLFSAVFNASGGSGTAVEAQVQVSEASDFSTTVWDSGWTAITACNHGQRSDEIAYAGTALSSAPADNLYYARIRFRDGSAVESDWAAGTFAGLRRPWALPGYSHRVKLEWDTEHDGIDNDYTQKFLFKSGLREIVADDGYFNESIQASGGFQVIEGNGKTHILYLSEYADSNEAEIKVITQDHLTGIWGKGDKKGHLIDGAYTTFDTHNFPVGCLDNDGYLHCFYGCHTSSLRYLRTKYPNVTGSHPDDPIGEELWINPATGLATPAVPPGATGSTYPIAITVRSTGRVYVMYRDGTSGLESQWCFNFTDDNGVTWSSKYCIIDDQFFVDSNNRRYRVYPYGIRFDEKTQRLHFSWTHNHRLGGVNDIERGIWYAYCDFDETDANAADVGFNILRWSDGSLAGYTSPNPGSQPAIDFVPSKAIKMAHADGYGTDDYARIFTETLVLDANGQPVVFWEQKWKDGSPTNETDLMCARWSADIGQAGSWTIVPISQQLNMMLRVRRSSIGIMADKDGILKGMMPVNAKTYYRHLPTGDVDDISTTSTEATNYQAVDDGFSTCDGDTSTITIQTGGQASFSQAGTLPAGAEVLEVDIEVVARGGGAGSAFVTGYLSDGITDDDNASPTSVLGGGADYNRVYQTWQQNPFTAAAWQPGDLSGLEFGVKCPAGGPLIISRCILRVKYTLANDQKHASSEVWEIRSDDGGLTWTARESSRNSSVGVPILNHKHQLTNDTIEIAWCSGHEIFYLTDKPFGLAQRSGVDIRLMYGDTEIDRVLDYTNLNQSRIQFRVQEAIPAGRKAGPKDYYLYYGNPNETTQPLADPANVFNFYESFETYDRNSNIHGVNGWSVISGSATIYASPPDHANKVFAGEKALETASAAVIERTLGSGLTDLLVEVGVWMETSGGDNRCYFKLLDAASDEFGVGFQYVANKTGYLVNTVWTLHDTMRATYKHYWPFAIQVTSVGCTGLFFDREVIREATAITSVDKLQLVCPANTFWDYIRVSKRYKHSIFDVDILSVALDQPNMIVHANHAASYDDSADAIHEHVHPRAVKITVEIAARDQVPGSSTADFHIWLSRGETYDGNSIYDDQTLQLTGISDSDVTGSVVFDDLPEGPYSIKVDCYATTAAILVPKINKVTYDHRTLEPTIVFGDTERQGFYIDAVIKGAGLDQFTMDANVDGYALRARATIPVESAQSQASFGSIPTEALASLARGGIARIENVQSMAATIGTLIEILRGGQTVLATPVELLAGLGATSTMLAGLIASKDVARPLPVEFTGSATAARAALVEQLGSFEITPARVPIEFHGSIGVSGNMPFQWLASSETATRFYIDSTATVLRSGQLLSEVLEHSEHAAMTPVDIQKTLATAGRFLVETLGIQPLEVTGRLPLDWTISVDTAGRVIVEHLSPAILSAALQAEQLASTNSPGLVQVDSIAIVDRLVGIQSEWLRRVESARSFPIEITKLAGASLQAQVEQLLTVARDGQIPTEWAGGTVIEIPGQIPISWLGSIATAGRLPLEHVGSREVVAGRLLVESSQEVFGVAAMPIEISHGMAQAQRILADWFHAIDAHGHLRIENRGWTQAVASLRIEFGHDITVVSEIPIETLVALSASGQLPADWLGAAFTAMMIINARLEVPGMLGATLSIPKLREAVLEVPAVTDQAVKVSKLTEAAIEIVRILKGGKTGA